MPKNCQIFAISLNYWIISNISQHFLPVVELVFQTYLPYSHLLLYFSSRWNTADLTNPFH